MTNPIIVALDVPSTDAAVNLATNLNGHVGLFKIGLELFVAEGPKVVESVKQAAPDVDIFLDLKLHDIPNTMRGAIRSAKNLGVRFMTAHAGSGPSHLQACVEEAGDNLGILGVTILTSMDEDDCHLAGHTRNPQELVQIRAIGALEAGCAGIVCSGQELPSLDVPKNGKGGQPFFRVVPGIRPAGDDVGDQKRVMTPGKAIEAGANFLVIGRAIRGAVDPAEAAKSIFQEIEAAKVG